MFAQFFIRRPVFASVCALLIVLAGATVIPTLPISQFPDLAPPQVGVTSSYIGASAQTVESAVTIPLEQEINGVENMLYMNSQSTGDGNLTITVTFRIGTDLNVAQMLTQNRVQDVITRLPDDVQERKVEFRITQEVVLWNQYVMILFILLITAEWVIRKFANLS